MTVQGALWLAKCLSLNLNFSFHNRIRYFPYQVATQMSSRGWVDRIPDPINPEKFLGYSRELNPGPLGWQSDVLITIPNRWSNTHLHSTKYLNYLDAFQENSFPSSAVFLTICESPLLMSFWCFPACPLWMVECTLLTFCCFHACIVGKMVTKFIAHVILEGLCMKPKLTHSFQLQTPYATSQNSDINPQYWIFLYIQTLKSNKR